MTRDWRRRHLNAALLPPLDLVGYPPEIKADPTEERRFFCTFGDSDVECDERCERLRYVTDPLEVLAICAPHLLPKLDEQE